MKNFQQTMGILANTRTPPPVPGRWVVMPRAPESVPGTRRARVLARRRRTFERLVLAAASTLILGLIPGLRGVLWAHAMLDLCVVSYVMQLKRWQVADRARVARAHSAMRAARTAMPTVASGDPRAAATAEADAVADAMSSIASGAVYAAEDRTIVLDDTQPVRRIVLDDLSAVAG